MQRDNGQPDEHYNIRMFFKVGFWLLLFVFAVVFFQRIIDAERNPNTSPATHYNDGAREVVLQRNRYGHYNLTGYINGHEVEFLLDTGATHISIPEHIAKKIGLPKLHEMEFKTANGIAKGFATKIDSVQVGNIKLVQLKADINPNVDDDTVLLGMAFLKRIEFTQRGDTLILRQYDY